MKEKGSYLESDYKLVLVYPSFTQVRLLCAKRLPIKDGP